ncbi:hypothetical protein MVEG_01987 [Podila verticillata NRRL 6337]|nr:hypothetical protein MVEG_01987 [Podila verticillata NRRL 6337]
MPIQVFYAGDQDLSPSRQEYIRKITGNIEVIDITLTFDNGYLQLQGWAIKSFALLASKFENAMVIDADVFFLWLQTFWIGFEMIQDPYAFVQSTGSVIGELQNINRTMVCGFLLHLEYLERPMRWNGGLMRNKDRTSNGIWTMATGFMAEGCNSDDRHL